MNYSHRIKAIETDIERRRDIRIPYSESIYFATKKQIYEGKLRNLSRSGLYIKTNEFFSEGEIIIVAIPCSDRQNARYKGQIIWFDQEGLGIKLKSKLP
jgi:Tfp pilus assembly protein PilZ